MSEVGPLSRKLSAAQRRVLTENAFKKGQPSANPGGRPKGVAALARELSAEGRIPLEYLLGVVQNDAAPLRERTEAAREVLNRSFGKPLEQSAILQLENATSEQGQALLGGALESLARVLSERKEQQPAASAEGNPDAAA